MSSSNVFLMNTPSDTAAPEVYYFKSNLTEGNFYNFKTNSTTKVWVFSESVNGIGEGWNIDNSSNIPKNFVFLTSNASSVTVNNAIGSSKFNTTNMYFPNISSENATAMSVTPATTYYFGVDAKKASYNGSWGVFIDMLDTEHLQDVSRDETIDATCVANKTSNTYCFCGYVSTVIEENTALGHNYDEFLGLTYESFSCEGTYKYQCKRCGDVNITKADPLFVNLGFSCSQYGDMMSVNYKVNAEAIAEYEKITGEAVNYGVFAVTKKNIEKNDIFGAEGNALSGVIAADITGTGFNLFSLKITGFTEAQKELPFAMGAFVGAEKDGATEYSYLQIAAPAEGEKYYFATYNEVAKLAPSDNEESAQ